MPDSERPSGLIGGSAADLSLLFKAFKERPRLTGFVANPKDWSQRFVVELLVDGWPIDQRRANRYDRRMPDQGQHALDFGFQFDLSRWRLPEATALELRIANTKTALGTFFMDAEESGSRPMAGSVEWQGGTRFTGWLARSPDDDHSVRFLIDEDPVLVSKTDRMRLGTDAARLESRPAFDIHLPHRFADGRVRRLDVIDDDGQHLEGSPVSFFAFEDGLARFLDRHAEVPGEQIRGSEFEAMFPQSVPFGDWSEWMDRFCARSPSKRPVTIALVLVGEDGVEATLASLATSQADWVLGVLPSAEHDGRFDAHDLSVFLVEEAANASFVVMAMAGTIFQSDALQGLADALSSSPNASAAYCDVLVASASSDRDLLCPIAFTDFDYERLLEQGYPIWCFALRPETAKAAAVAGADSLASLFFKTIDPQLDPTRVPVHVPSVLAQPPMLDLEAASLVLARVVKVHLAERGVRADAEPRKGQIFPAIFVRRAITAERVSVILPTRDRVDDTRACIDHLRGLRTRHTFEMIIVDMASSDPAMLRFLTRPDLRSASISRMEGGHNIARALNEGASRAASRFLLFLDPRMTLVDPDPIENLISRCADPTTAAAAPTIVWPEGIVQSNGLILGHRFGERPACRGLGDADAGYGDMMRVAQERSALSTTCLLVKRDDHQALMGFDERRFGTFFYAVDYGLRLRQRGRRLVVTPHARAVSQHDLHAEEAFAGTPWKQAAHRRELATLRLEWGSLLQDDPFYSPLLGLDGDLHSALAWPPRRLHPASIDSARPIRSHEQRQDGLGERIKSDLKVAKSKANK